MAEQIPIEQVQFVGPKVEMHVIVGTSSNGQAVMMFEGVRIEGDAMNSLVPEEVMAILCRGIAMHLDSIAPKPPAMILLPHGAVN